jgi:hypothetical protein
MKVHTLVALGAISMGGVWLASAPPLEAHDCCHGHNGCPMMSGKSADAPSPGAGPAMGRIYDPDTVSTLRGKATAVEVVPGRGGRSGGTHVTLEGADQTIDVRLGPTWFLEREGIEIAKGDSMEVTGSVIESDGDSFLIARELKKGEKVVKLRDEQGVPLWSGRGRP